MSIATESQSYCRTPECEVPVPSRVFDERRTAARVERRDFNRHHQLVRSQRGGELGDEEMVPADGPRASLRTYLEACIESRERRRQLCSGLRVSPQTNCTAPGDDP